MKKENGLTEVQLKTIDLLISRKTSGLTIEEVANEASVSRRTITRWKQTPEFMAEMKRRSVELLSEAVPFVLEVLTHKALEGNTKSLELFLKTAGLLRTEVDVTARQVIDERSNEYLESELNELKEQLKEFESNDN